MAKKPLSERWAGRRQSKNVEDIRPAQRKEKAQANKDQMDIYMPHNKIIKSKDLKRVRDEATKLNNMINNSDSSRATRLKNLKSKTKPQKLSKSK